jgi:hypothetical protein
MSAVVPLSCESQGLTSWDLVSGRRPGSEYKPRPAALRAVVKSEDLLSLPVWTQSGSAAGYGLEAHDGADLLASARAAKARPGAVSQAL